MLRVCHLYGEGRKFLQSISSRDKDVENKHMDAKGEGVGEELGDWD